MFFDHYPYTNFHNVNLDWVLQAVKAWGQTVKANDQAFKDLKEANESFKAYVRNYLQDLDVSDEINTKLDRMLAEGTLTPYFAPYVKGYVESWLASNVTPTTPALDKTLSISDAAADAAATGEKIVRASFLRTLDDPELYKVINKNHILPGYRIQSACHALGYFFVCGGSEAEDGTGFIAKMSDLDFKDAEITYIQGLGHANDITYSNTDHYLYITTVGEGVEWGIVKINPNDFTDRTLITNCPYNTIGIQYVAGWMYILAPYRIYRTLNFETYDLVIENTNDILNKFGIPERGSQTLVRVQDDILGWVGTYMSEPEHRWHGFIVYFGSDRPITFELFPTYNAECQAGVWDGHSVYFICNGTTSPAYTILKTDLLNLKYHLLGTGKDLNNYYGEGIYYLIGAATMDNCPVNNEGLTLHVGPQGLLNTRQDIYTNSGRHLYRIKLFNAGTWGDWVEQAAEIARIKEDLTTLSDLNSTLVRSLFTADKSGGGVDFTYVPEDGSFNVTTETVVTNKNNAWKNLLAAGNDLYGMIPGETYFCEIEKSGEGAETVNVWWKFYRDGVQDGNSHALYDSGFITIDEWASGIVLRLAASTNGVALNCNIKIRLERYMSNRALQNNVTVMSDKLAGIQPALNILTLGDSIALGVRNGNRGFVGDLGMPYINIGVSGASISTVRTNYKNVFTQLIDYQSANPSYVPDCIIADGGINDYISSAPMGDIPNVPAMDDTEAEALDKSTLMGATGYLFYKMIKLYPRAQRYFVIVHKIKRGENNVYYPTHTRPGIEYTQEDMHDALVKVCGVYGVKVVDVYKDSMLNTAFSQYVSPTAYSTDPSVTDLYFTDTDGLHPLALGYREAYVPLVKLALMGATKK